ncbi:MAG: SpoIIE family protein phosphatase [Phycisphaerales bacterium]|nr:SpoIIE family protein phosphatase [Phycisphaerales bacterium]
MLEPPRTPTIVDERYHRAFGAERARVLRRRITIYCGVALVLVALSFFGTLMDFAHPYHDDGTPIRTLWSDVISDLLLAASFAGTAWFVIAKKPRRTGLVPAVTILTVLVGVIAAVSEMISRRAEPDIASGLVSQTGAAWILTRLCAADFLVFQGMASLLIPMRLREQVRLVAPCWTAFATVALMMIPGSFGMVQLGFIVLFPLLATPAVLWSTWRYREFDARFAGKEIAFRFGEVSEELAYARRIHEALFPPQLDRGPVRVRYRYEPMRQIGGDFLFVHPLAFPPSEVAGPVSVVIIDVSGHGVPAALAVNRLHGELQRLFATTPAIEPGALIAALNAYTHAALAPQGVFATGCAARLDPTSRTLSWASAGHPPAFFRRADGTIEELHSTATMLGVLDASIFEGEQINLPIAEGDSLLAYTDGATEARSDSGEFTIARARAIAAQGDASPAAALMDAVRSHRMGIVDDDTLVVEVSLAAAPTPA